MEKEEISSNYGVIMSNNYYLNPNYYDNNSNNDPFEYKTPSNCCGDNLIIKELIGRLGCISNNSIFNNNNNDNNININYVNKNLSGKINGELSSRVNSRETSFVSAVILPCKSQNVVNSRKRNSFCKGNNFKGASSTKDDEILSTFVEVEEEESDGKRSKVENEVKCENSNKVKKKKNSENNDTEEAEKTESPKDYIHVRARRGQATDSHSLAERVRREKISERMKFLQDLVPGCNKVTGKATVLDEIINYVQSLQRQVEFLSMKLSTMNPRTEFNMEALLAKDMFQSRVPSLLPQTIYSDYSLDQNSAREFPFVYQSTHQIPLPFPTDGFVDSLTELSTLWEDDLQGIVPMGNFPNQAQNVTGTVPNNAHMKVEP